VAWRSVELACPRRARVRWGLLHAGEVCQRRCIFLRLVSTDGQTVALAGALLWDVACRYAGRTLNLFFLFPWFSFIADISASPDRSRPHLLGATLGGTTVFRYPGCSYSVG
jgi:hypothetical protein